QGEIIAETTPDAFFDSPHIERTKLFLSQILHYPLFLDKVNPCSHVSGCRHWPPPWPLRRSRSHSRPARPRHKTSPPSPSSSSCRMRLAVRSIAWLACSPRKSGPSLALWWSRTSPAPAATLAPALRPKRSQTATPW